MEAGFVVILVAVVFILGVLTGYVLSRVGRSRYETHGELYVKPNAPEGQGLYLVQTVPTNTITSQKQAIFDVIVVR